MGNVPSSDGQGNGHKSVNKLSKPRMTQEASAGPPTSNELTYTRRGSILRTSSVPYGAAAYSPMPVLAAGRSNSHLDDASSGDMEKLSVKRLFRSRSSQVTPRRSEEIGAASIINTWQSTRPSRANSMARNEEQLYNAQSNNQG
jgi:hypothetical protein